MGKFQDLTGKKFGRLTVIERAESRRKPCGSVIIMWLCECDCEKKNRAIVAGAELKSGDTKSCGCYRKEYVAQKSTKHGRKHDRVYRIWQTMKTRCGNSNNKDYALYGAEGKVVCEEWCDKENGSSNFIKWALSNGYKENLELERIDNTRGYSPNNCRWATRKEQMNNTRRNCYITYNGERYTLQELADNYKINRSTLKYRLNKGWSIEKALTTPTKIRRDCLK